MTTIKSAVSNLVSNPETLTAAIGAIGSTAGAYRGNVVTSILAALWLVKKSEAARGLDVLQAACDAVYNSAYRDCKVISRFISDFSPIVTRVEKEGKKERLIIVGTQKTTFEAQKSGETTKEFTARKAKVFGLPAVAATSTAKAKEAKPGSELTAWINLQQFIDTGVTSIVTGKDENGKATKRDFEHGADFFKWFDEISYMEKVNNQPQKAESIAVSAIKLAASVKNNAAKVVEMDSAALVALTEAEFVSVKEAAQAIATNLAAALAIANANLVLVTESQGARSEADKAAKRAALQAQIAALDESAE